jgi:hypothetical protein
MQFLDPPEAAALMDAFLVAQGRFGAVTFTDPWDGIAATGAHLGSDELTLTQTGEDRFSAQLTLVEEGD